MSTLNTTELELVYDHLARAIDEVGPDQSLLFLTKLALLCAQSLGSLQKFVDLSEQAAQDL